MSIFYSQSIKSVLVLGSSSVVAKSICLELAKKGCKKFHLICRDTQKHHDLKNTLTDFYSTSVSEQEIDLLSYIDANNIIMPKVDFYDLYLITAGTLGDASFARTNISEAFNITKVNFTSLIPWLTAIVSEENIIRNSRLWVFSSVAGDLGRPSNYHYGASKSALTTFCEGLMLRCQGKPFCVRVIKAGFMKTPMTIKKAPEILCADTKSIARFLLKSPDKRGVEYLPWWWRYIMLIIKLMPANLTSKL
tara:strand:- start:2861 stop:3607 length:747 start_codon:yes stop_codon:yes gene_type:complete